jgi:hypothetical protein
MDKNEDGGWWMVGAIRRRKFRRGDLGGNLPGKVGGGQKKFQG